MATGETAFEGSSDKRENSGQKSGSRKGRGRRGGRGRNNSNPNGPKPLTETNINSISNLNATKVQ
jgi:hypothetical protein